jgi:o-succinylbenzoate synthase
MNRVLPGLSRVDAIRVGIPFKTPFTTANGVFAVRTSWILRLRSSDGREGFGEAAVDPGAPVSAYEELSTAVRDALPMMMAGRLAWPDPLTPGVRAVWSGVDGALEWLKASGSTTTLARSVAVNATIGVLEPGETARAAHEAVSAGYRCVKVKAGAGPNVASLVDRVRAVRESVGPNVQIRVDVNGTWDYATATDMLAALTPFGLEYVEQPLAAWDLAGLASLRRSCSVAIAADESAESLESVASILAKSAADVLVIKPSRVGGPSAVEAIAALAASHSIPVVLSTFFETGVGITAALRAAAILPEVGVERVHGLATAGALATDLLTVPIALAGGRMTLSTLPTVDEAALERFALERFAVTG